MRNAGTPPRLFSAAVSVMVTALLLTVSLPHHHDKTSTSHHPTQSCRLCKLNEGFSAAPSSPAVIRPALVLVARALPVRHPLPRVRLLVRRSAPRAPPVLS